MVNPITKREKRYHARKFLIKQRLKAYKMSDNLMPYIKTQSLNIFLKH